MNFLWRVLANIVLPRRWTRRAFPPPPILLEWFDWRMRTELLPEIADALYAPNPLFEAFK
jgi:hypothetical protein